MKKLFEKITKAWVATKKRWKAETPKFWKAVFNLSNTALVAVPSIVGLGEVLPSIPVPEWFTTNVWYVMAVATAVSTFAKTRVKKPSTKNAEQNEVA